MRTILAQIELTYTKGIRLVTVIPGYDSVLWKLALAMASSSFNFDGALAYTLSCVKQEVLSLKDQQVEAVKLLSEGDVFVVTLSFILNCYCACMLTGYCVRLLTVVFVECHVLKWS